MSCSNLTQNCRSRNIAFTTVNVENYNFLIFVVETFAKSSKPSLVWRNKNNYYSSRDKFKIVSHWRPEWCQRVTFTVGLVVALKHLCTKSEVSRCWGHGTQDTRKLRSLKKCRTALQAERPVTMQLQFWKGEAPCTATGFCVRCLKKESGSLMPLS